MIETCVFCQIVKGQAPAGIVRRDELCTAFLDIRPVNVGHLLVVPNEHATHLADLPPDTGAHLFRVAQRMAAVLRAADLPCDGANLLLSDGRTAGQEVMHVHMHVIPRVAGDAFRIRFGRGPVAAPTPEELADVAARLRAI